MNYAKYLEQEQKWVDITNPPSSRADFIPGPRGRIFSTTYLPEGKKPHPVVIMCHGIPGNEKLLDFGMALRDAGFSAISFHYSGSWGSDGDYSIRHCFEDAKAVVDFVVKNENKLFDSSRIYVLGHSLGGLVGSRIIALEAAIRGGVLIMPYNVAQSVREAASDPVLAQKWQATYDTDFGAWLKNYNWKALQEETMEHLEDYDVASYGTSLAKKPLLTIGGILDDFIIPRVNMALLREAILAVPNNKLEAVDIETDHGMNMNRALIKGIVVDYLKEIDCRKK